MPPVLSDVRMSVWHTDRSETLLVTGIPPAPPMPTRLLCIHTARLTFPDQAVGVKRHTLLVK